MKTGLQQKQGTLVIEDLEEIERLGVGALYKEGQIFLDPRDPDIGKYVSLHHEAVHSSTNHLIRTDPGNPENVLALTVSRLGAPIDKDLPAEYRRSYGADEMKAYAKNSLLFEQLSRESGVEPKRIENRKKLAKLNRDDSATFARVTQRVLQQVIALLNSGNHLSIDVYPWDADLTGVFVVEIRLPQSRGQPIIVRIPLYDPSSDGYNIKNLFQKLLQVCENGLAITSRYTGPKF